MASTEAAGMASAEVAPTKAAKMASAEVTPTDMASTEAAEMASAEVAPTKAAKMASAKPSNVASAIPSPHATTSKVASTTSEVAAPTSSSTMLAKRHRATRHRESTDGNARQQRHDGAA